MSDLLYSWLNDEVQLTKKITNFESDFANGFFFGELLSKYNQQLNFKEFENRDLRVSKLKNFKMLEPTLKTLRVNSDSTRVDEIINQEKGVAERMLYELKMALEKVNNPADIMILHKTGKFNPITPLKKLEVGKPQYDLMESKFFDRRINEMNRAQKIVNLEKHLKPYEEFKERQDAILKKRREEDILKESKIKEEMRKIQLNKLQRNMAFLENWNEKGKENWEKNQKVMKERVKKDDEFRAKTQERKAIRLQAIHEQNQKEILQGIAHFESNLKKLGLDSPEGEKKGISLDKSHTMFSASATMLRIKEKKMVSDFMRKERDKRRRKMIVDQAKAQREIEVRKRQELLLEKLNQQSRQEKELTYEIWRAERCKEIIKENRVLREGKYKQKRESCVLSSKYKEEEMLQILRDEFTMDIEAKRIRMSELQVQEKKEYRKANYSLMKGIMNEIFEISDLLFSHQQDQDEVDFSQNFYSEIVKLFTNSKQLIPYRSIRNPLGVKALSLEYDAPIKESIDFLTIQELNEYIEGSGMWVPMHKGDAPENPELDDKYTPKTSLNNFYLGNLVRFLVMRCYEEKQNQEEMPVPSYLPLKLALMGYEFSGKRTLISYLIQKYGLEPIYIEKLLEEALEKANEFVQSIESEGNAGFPEDSKEKEFLELALEIRKNLATGKKLPDILYVKLIIFRLQSLFPAMNYKEFVDFYTELPAKTQKQIAGKKESVMGVAPLTKEELFLQNLMSNDHKYTKGWILYDFPQTYDQAKLLEEHLSGFLPKDECAKLEFESRLELASLLAKPTPPQIVPRKLKRSGLDCAFVLKTTKEECLRRALGRKHDSLTKVNYHLDDSVPPTDNAPLIERLESKREVLENELVLVDKLNAFDVNMKDLKEWMQNFGLREIGVNLWQEIEVFKDPVLSFEMMSKILEQILEHKEKMIELELERRKKEKDESEKAAEEAKLMEEREKEMNMFEPDDIKQELLQIQKNTTFCAENLKIEQISNKDFF